jgi:hypothetical protein
MLMSMRIFTVTAVVGGYYWGGASEWSIEKHGTKIRRAWRKLHIGLNAEMGEIIAADLTTNDMDDASQVGSLLGQVAGPIAALWPEAWPDDQADGPHAR